MFMWSLLIAKWSGDFFFWWSAVCPSVCKFTYYRLIWQILTKHWTKHRWSEWRELVCSNEGPRPFKKILKYRENQFVRIFSIFMRQYKLNITQSILERSEFKFAQIKGKPSLFLSNMIYWRPLKISFEDHLANFNPYDRIWLVLFIDLKTLWRRFLKDVNISL